MKIGYVALMAIGSVVMWFGVPLFCIWIAAQTTDTTQPTLGPYMIVLFGVPAGMVAVGKALGALNRSYERNFLGKQQRYRAPWNRSMRGEREGGHQWTTLDTVMFWSVGVALVLFGIWFFFFAGSSLPTGP